MSTGVGIQCCGFGIADETLTVDGKTFRVTELRDIIAKHNRLAAKGVKPFLSLHEELGVSQDTVNKILLGET